VLKGGGEIVRHDGGGWKGVPGKAQDAAIGANGAVWAIGHDERGAGGFCIWRWDGKGWNRVDGAGVSIAVGPNGLPWVINASGDIYERV
jgi:hypothetical protein